MSKYSNYSVIPFYGFEDGEEKGWDCRNWYSWGQIYPLLSSKHLLPFFFKINGGSNISNINVYRLNNKSGLEVSLSDFERILPYSGSWIDKFTNSGMAISGDVLYYTSSNHINMLTTGYYYIEITVGGYKYVSEIFKVENSMTDNRLLLNWWDDKEDNQNTHIPYDKGFKNELIVESTLGMPNYEYEEEGENRMGYFYPIKKISYKKYKFNFVAPEYLCDVLRLIPLSDYIEVTDNRGEVLTPTDFNIDFNWLDGGRYAKVDCEFTTDTVVKKIGGSGSISPVPPPPVEEGSFNKSFNNSFK